MGLEQQKNCKVVSHLVVLMSLEQVLQNPPKQPSRAGSLKALHTERVFESPFFRAFFPCFVFASEGEHNGPVCVLSGIVIGYNARPSGRGGTLIWGGGEASDGGLS
jgi:hypothetical protein